MEGLPLGGVLPTGGEGDPPEQVQPWEALRMSEADFASVVDKCRGDPSIMRAGEREGGMLHRVLFEQGQEEGEGGIPPKVAAEVVGWLLCGEEPTEWLRRLKETGHSSICGHIFKDDEMVFKCFTCATDPTCCVCAQCFEGSDCVARGHQYQIFKAGAGGCCDCGDHEAWHPSGFCKRHSGPSDEDPLAAMPQDLVRVAEELFGFVLHYCCRAFTHDIGEVPLDQDFMTILHNDSVHEFGEVERAVRRATGCAPVDARRLTRKAHTDGYCMVKSGGKNECLAAMLLLREAGLLVNVTTSAWLSHESRATALLGLLRDVCGCSNGLRRVVCNILLSECGISAQGGLEGYVELDGEEDEPGMKYVDLLMRRGHHFWQDVQATLHDFYIQMIAEDAFKNTFAATDSKTPTSLDIFISIYPRLMIHLKHSVIEGGVSLLDLSVQIFTVPTVVTRLVRDCRLLETLFKCLYDLFAPHAAGGGDRISPNSPVMQKTLYQRLCHDIQYVLRIPGTSAAFSRHPDAVSMWLSLCSRAQGMDHHTRQITTHVEFEVRTWSYAFALALELVPVHSYLLTGYKQMLQEGFDGPHKILVLDAAAKALGEWFRTLIVGGGGGMQSVTDEDGSSFSTMHYDVSSKPVSFHLPLSRFLLASWAACAASGSAGFDLDVLLSNSLGVEGGIAEAALTIMEHPLRLFILLAQSQAGMWVRNGVSIPGQQYVYAGSSLCETMMETDIGALQFGCCALGADDFVRVLKYRFGVSYWLDTMRGPPPSPPLTPEQTITLLEELVTLLIQVLLERGVGGGGEDGAQSIRRKVIHRLAMGPQTHSMLGRGLPRSVTDSAEFDAVLKEVSHYKRPDPSATGTFELKESLLTTANPFSCSLSRKEREIVMELQREKCPAALPPYPLPPSHLGGLTQLLLSPVLWRFIRRVLSVALEHATGASPPSDEGHYVTDTLLHETLQLVSLALSYAQGGGRGKGWDEVALLLLDGAERGVAGLIGQLAQCGGKLSDSCRFEHSAHKGKLAVLVKLMVGSGNEGLKDLFKEWQEETKGSDAEAEDRAKRQKEARERAMAQMAAQQKAFSAMLSVESDDDEDMDEGRDGGAGGVEEASATEHACGDELQEENEEEARQCVLCHEEGCAERQLGLVCYCQASSVVSIAAGRRHGDKAETSCSWKRGCALEEASELGWEGEGSEHGHGIAVSFCGHAMHIDCLNRYMTSLEGRIHNVNIGHGALVADGEFPCPLCRGLGNALVPLLNRSDASAKASSSSQAAEGAGIDLASCTVKELRQIAKDHNVSLAGYTEKAEIVNALQRVTLAGLSASGDGGQGGGAAAGAGGASSSEAMLDMMSKRMYAAHEKMCRLRELRGMDGAGVGRASTFCCPAACAVSASVYTLTATESAARALGVGVSEMELSRLTHLVRSARAKVESLRGAKDAEWRWKMLRQWAQLLGGSDGEGGEGLMGRDVWGLFAHWLVLLQPTRGLAEEFEGVLRIIWVAKVVQTIAAVSRKGDSSAAALRSALSERATDPEDHLDALARMVCELVGEGGAEAGDAAMQTLADGGEEGVEAAAKRQRPGGGLEEVLEEMCGSFLRRAVLLRACLLGVKWPGGGAGEWERDAMLGFLRLPGKFGLGSVDGAVKELVVGWCRQIKATPTLPDPAVGASGPSLFALPEWYHDVLKARLKEKCQRCNTLPNEPAVCLLCGTLVCAGNDCCKKDGETGECTRHAISCGAGCAPFLFVKQCLLVLLRVGGGCRHTAPYLDAYGEEDPGLERGRPLQMSVERYAKLLQLWATHKLHAEIARSPQRDLLWDSI